MIVVRVEHQIWYLVSLKAKTKRRRICFTDLRKNVLRENILGFLVQQLSNFKAHTDHLGSMWKDRLSDSITWGSDFIGLGQRLKVSIFICHPQRILIQGVHTVRNTAIRDMQCCFQCLTLKWNFRMCVDW